MREVGAGAHFQAMPLPEGMAVTSSDVIASLNEHLIQVVQVRTTSAKKVAELILLYMDDVYCTGHCVNTIYFIFCGFQEVSLKEEMIVKMETSLDSYKRKFAVMRHQQSLIYTDFVQDQKVGSRNVH